VRSLILSCLGSMLFMSSMAQAMFSHDHDMESGKNESKISGPQDALNWLKGLQGEWKGVDEQGNEVVVSYEVVSGGTAVLEHVFDMVNVYHLNMDKLEMTHYCSANNQPKFNSVGLLPNGKGIDFDFVSISNLTDVNSGYISDLELHLADENTLVQKWSWTQAGAEMSFDFTLTKVKK
jgi:hypothetical protein